MEGGGSSGHGAAGQALGYLYQSYLPLLQLARRAAGEPEVVLRLELLDDVQFDMHGTPTELVQAKHHLTTRGDLSDTSVDLWRTINVWMSALEQLDPNEVPALTLVTTQTASDGSASSYLRGEDRDEARAQSLLETAAISSTNGTTQPWRTRFLRLPAGRQAALVEAITIADGAVTLDDFDAELAKELVFALPTSHAQHGTFIDHVKGWWLSIAIRLLKSDLEAFTAADLLQAVHDIRDQYGPENLPTDPDLPDADASVIASHQGRVFLRQLELIAATNEQLSVAIRDCYRAFVQRSRWLRRDLVGVGEIDRYERKLVDDWRFVFTNLTAELAAECGEEDMQRCGRQILAKAAESASARIRAQYDESFMTRGSLHLLADERELGWHPEFEARLETLLGPVVESA